MEVEVEVDAPEDRGSEVEVVKSTRQGRSWNSDDLRSAPGAELFRLSLSEGQERSKTLPSVGPS